MPLIATPPTELTALARPASSIPGSRKARKESGSCCDGSAGTAEGCCIHDARSSARSHSTLPHSPEDTILDTLTTMTRSGAGGEEGTALHSSLETIGDQEGLFSPGPGAASPVIVPASPSAAGAGGSGAGGGPKSVSVTPWTSRCAAPLRGSVDEEAGVLSKLQSTECLIGRTREAKAVLRNIQRQTGSTPTPSVHSQSNRFSAHSVVAPGSPAPSGTHAHPVHCSSHSSHGSHTVQPGRPLATATATASHVGSISSAGGSFGRSSGGPLLEQFKCGTLQERDEVGGRLYTRRLPYRMLSQLALEELQATGVQHAQRDCMGGSGSVPEQGGQTAGADRRHSWCLAQQRTPIPPGSPHPPGLPQGRGRVVRRRSTLALVSTATTPPPWEQVALWLEGQADEVWPVRASSSSAGGGGGSDSASISDLGEAEDRASPNRGHQHHHGKTPGAHQRTQHKLAKSQGSIGPSSPQRLHRRAAAGARAGGQAVGLRKPGGGCDGGEDRSSAGARTAGAPKLPSILPGGGRTLAEKDTS